MPNQTNRVSNVAIITVAAILFLLSFLGVQLALAQNSCPLNTRRSYKSSGSPSVWYISSDCTKRPIKNPAVFFSHFRSWDDVSVVPLSVLNNIVNNELGFLPWGRLRNFKNGSLIKTVDDPKVYVMLDGIIYPILSENVYRKLGYSFTHIEDVTTEVLAAYQQGRDIADTDDYPGSLVFQYENSPRVYVLERDLSGVLRKRYVESYDDLERDYRVDRIAVFDIGQTFSDSPQGTVRPGESLRRQDERETFPDNVEGEVVNEEQSETNENESSNTPVSQQEPDEQEQEPEEEESETEDEVVTGPVCGNAVREAGEFCDDGSANGQAGECNSSCSEYIPLANEAEEQTEETNENESTSEQTTNSGSNTYTPPAPTPTVNLVAGDTPNSCSVSGYGLTGQTYYFCNCSTSSSGSCSPGSSANDGLSPSSPKMSLSAALQTFNTMPAGSTVALCRGGAFDTNVFQVFNQNCNASNRCQLTSYGDNNLPRPIIWSSGSGIAFEDGGSSDADAGYVLTNLDIRSKTQGNSQSGVFVYNDADDIYACNLRIDNFGIGVHVAGHNSISTGDGKSDRFEIHHSEIVNNNNQGWLGGCDDCVINTTYFDNNGYLAPGGGPLSHSIYISSGSVSDPVRNMRVTNNEIYRSVYANGNNSCQGTVLVVHGGHDGHLIENNFIQEPQGTAGQGCWGISVDPAYSYPELFRNITVRNNTIEYVGNRSVNLEQCDNCTASNNTILYNTTFGN